MAYSDYGGYAYRNRELQLQNCDTTIADQMCHALLGDGAVQIGLYKQTSFHLFVNGEEIDEVVACGDGVKKKKYTDTTYIDTEYYKKTQEPCCFEVEGYKITFYWLETDNHYQYCQLVQPDGTIWTGFSGYGVGCGLEDGGHGFSTSEQVDKLFWLFSNKPTQPISKVDQIERWLKRHGAVDGKKHVFDGNGLITSVFWEFGEIVIKPVFFDHNLGAGCGNEIKITF